MSLKRYDLNKVIKRVEVTQDAAAILKYDRFNAVKGFSDARRDKIMRKLTILSAMSDKLLLSFNENDLFELIEKIKKKDIKPVTVEDYKVILRGFFKYHERDDLFKLLHVNNKIYHGSNTLPTEILTENEIKKIVEQEKSLMYQALIMSLWESGARIGEFLPLRIKNVHFDGDGCFFILADGKTGMRRTRLANSTSLLSNWIEYHPFKDNKNAPLWTAYNNEALGYRGLLKHLAKTFKRAGINKPCNPHHFRHSRATFLAQHITEAQIKEFFGWTQDSRMASRYVHLSGRDVDNAILSVYNMSSKRELTVQLEPIKCFNCKRLNEAGRSRCRYCSLPLDFNSLRDWLAHDLRVKQYKEKLEKINL